MTGCLLAGAWKIRDRDMSIPCCASNSDEACQEESEADDSLEAYLQTTFKPLAQDEFWQASSIQSLGATCESTMAARKAM